jgi:hypothetical protein
VNHAYTTIAALVLVLALPALASGGRARADPSICSVADCTPDIPGYLDQLRLDGISGDSNQVLISNGEKICGDIARGVPSQTESDRLRSANPLTPLHGNAGVDAALPYLCPQFMEEGLPMG